jgi:hypothetical protein
MDRGEIEGALRRLHDAHGLVLQPSSFEIWLAHPFSAAPSGVWVAAADRGWWSPCMWCAAGVVALAAPSATIHTRYAGEHEPAALAVRGGLGIDADVLVHFPIPPRDAWSNVAYWCSLVLPFRDAAQVDDWCRRHGFARGALVPWPQVLELGRVWYARHLDADFRKWSLAEAQAIFAQVGLCDSFWQLPEREGSF